MNDVDLDVMCTSFEDELQKIAQAKQAASGKALLGLGAGAGILGYEVLRRANEDRKLGRSVRKQQQGF